MVENTLPFERHVCTHMDVETDSEAAMEGEPTFCNIIITRDSTTSTAPRVPLVKSQYSFRRGELPTTPPTLPE